MPEFTARLATASGEIVERSYNAHDAQSLQRDLERQDFLVLAIRRKSAALAFFGDVIKRRKKIGQKEFLLFNQEFAALIRAGLPITECLELLSERRKNEDFRDTLRDVRNRVKQGDSLSEAFSEQESIPPIYSSALASGERSGEIATVIQRYVIYAQTMMNVRKKVTSALIYPAILFTVAIGVVLVLLLQVLPNFESFFSDLGADLPMITKVVVGISNGIRFNWGTILLGLGGLIVFLAIWRRTPTGQRVLERVLYALPVVGSIAKRFVVTRFARTLSTLVAGGIPLVSCLEVLGRSIGTPIFRDAVFSVERKIREGAGLWSSLDETELFPDLLIEMVKVGESSGSLAEMLTHVADFTDQEIEHELQTLVALVEPILLVFMAVVVATIVLAMFLPMLKLYAESQSF